jgi:uncharacterized membrane protein
VVVLFLISWALRIDTDEHRVSAVLVVVELIAVGVAGVAAWFGGELVDRLGIGVDDDAHPDATSSLTAQQRPLR